MAILEIDEKALRDERFGQLGLMTGTGKFDVRGRCEALWFDCIKTANAVRTAEEIASLTGWFEDGERSFAELMVRAKLAFPVEHPCGPSEPSESEQSHGDIQGQSKQMLGNAQVNSNPSPRLYKIRGVEKRMQWLLELTEIRREAASAGGKKTAKSAKRDAKGKFIRKESKQDPSKCLDHLDLAAKQTQANPSCTIHSSLFTGENKNKNTARIRALAQSGNFEPTAPPENSGPREAPPDEPGAPPGATAITGRPGIPEFIRREWEATLAQYQREPNWIRDEAPMFQAFTRKAGRDWRRLQHALAGFRFETKSTEPGGYDPARHVRLSRLQDAGSFEYLEGLGELGLKGSLSNPSEAMTAEEIKFRRDNGLPIPGEEIA